MPDGRPARLVGTLRDISEHKRAEAELAFQAGLLGRVHDAVMATDEHRCVTYMNRAAEELFGWRLEEAHTRQYTEVCGVDPAGPWRPAVADELVHAGHFEGELPLRRRDGTSFRADARVGLLRDAAGTIRGIVSSVRDITARTRAEQALRESARRLKVATDAAGLGIFEHDLAAGATDQWDRRVLELWGYTSEAPFTSELFLAGVHPDDRAAVEAEMARAVDPAGSGGFALEHRVVGLDDGVERWIAGRGQVFFADGRPVRVIGTVRDVSERRRTQALVFLPDCSSLALSEKTKASAKSPRAAKTAAGIGQTSLAKRIAYTGPADEVGQMLTALKIGELTYKQGATVTHLAVNWGYFEVEDDKVTVLVQTAEPADEIDLERAKAALGRAEEALKKLSPEDKNFVVYQSALDRALIRMQVAGKAEATSKKKSGYPFHGKLAAVDLTAKTLQVGKSTYHITSETKITKGGHPATLADGVVGEPVSGYVEPPEGDKKVLRSARFGPKAEEKGAEKKKKA